MAQAPPVDGWGIFTEEAKCYVNTISKELDDLADEATEMKRLVEETTRRMGNAIIITFAADA